MKKAEGHGTAFPAGANLRNIQFYINEISRYMSDTGSLLFINSVEGLKSFIGNVYQHHKVYSGEQVFIHQLMSTVSLEALGNNPLLFVIVINAALEVDLGDKMNKANRIARDILQTPPSLSSLVWHYFKLILQKLEKILKKSFQLTLQQVHKNTFDWMGSTDTTTIVSGLMITEILVKNFASKLDNLLKQALLAVIPIFENSDPAVFIPAKSLLISILKNAHEEDFPLYMKMITKFLMARFEISNINYEKIIGVCEAIQAIIKEYPVSIPSFKFKTVPSDPIFTKELVSNKTYTSPSVVAAYTAIPLALLTSPDIFTEDKMLKIFEVYDKVIKKNKILRNETLYALGNLIFSKRMAFSTKQVDLLSGIQRQLVDSLDSDESIFCFISLLTLSPKLNTRYADTALDQKLSDLYVDGFDRFLQLCPTSTETVHLRLITIANNILLKQDQSQTQILLAFQALSQLKVSPNSYSENLILEYCYHLKNPSLTVRKAAADVILHFQNVTKSSAVSKRLLDVVAIDHDEDFRIDLLQHLSKSTSDTYAIFTVHGLIRDTDDEIRHEAFKYLTILAEHSGVPELITARLNEFAVDLTIKSTVKKQDLEPFLVISDGLDDPAQPYAEPLRSILLQFAPFLIGHLSKLKLLPPAALQLLAQLISINSTSVDINLLLPHITHALQPYSSRSKLKAGIALLKSLLTNTDFNTHVTIEDLATFDRLLTSSVAETEEFQISVLTTLSSIGAIRPEILNLEDQSNKEPKFSHSPNTFINTQDPHDPVAALVYTSLGVTLSVLSDILLDTSFETLHTLALQAVFTILKSNPLDNTLLTIVLDCINKLLEVGESSTITTLLNNVPTLIKSLGSRFAVLVPKFVDLVCTHWGSLDDHLLLRLTEWMVMFQKKNFLPHILKVTIIFTENFQSLPKERVEDLLSLFISYGESISLVDHVVIPPLLDYIIFHAKEEHVQQSVIGRLDEILVLGGGKPFAYQIFRTIIAAYAKNKALHKQCLDIILHTGEMLGDQFRSHIPLLESIFDFTQSIDLCKLSTCVMTNKPYQPLLKLSIGDPNAPQRIPRAPAVHPDVTKSSANLPQISIDAIDLKLPKADFDELAWTTWFEDLVRVVFSKSQSRAITACREIAIRHNTILSSLFPIAFAILYYLWCQEKANSTKKEKTVNYDTFLKTIFNSPTTPL
ncbi:hypothetical protein NOY06_14880 [Psychrilyobacter sp. S5]|nr:hypothetical protein [Psychrilyobacter sp. S5]